MAKDFTKYKFEDWEKGIAKSRMVQKVVEHYASAMDMNYEELKEQWWDDIQGGKGIIRKVSEIDSKNERNYYINAPITLKDGTKIAVCNQWGKENFSNFILHAGLLNYKIIADVAEENEVSDEELTKTNIMYKLPEVITNNLKDYSNPDENIFAVYKYVNEHITNDDDLEQLYLAIIEFKPNAQIVGQYARELFEKGRVEVAISLIKNKEKYSGDDHSWKCFKSSERDILPISFTNPFKVYEAKDAANLNITINIHGRMHQVFSCTKEEDVNIDDIDDHYQNIFDWIYKIDDNNLMIIEVDGEKIFEGSLSELGIRETEVGYDLSKPKRKYITPKLEKIKQIKDFCEFDSDEVWVSKENHLLLIPQGRLEGDRGLELAPNFNNRYSMINYGKYNLEASVKVKSFAISDLFFQLDPCMDELVLEPEGGPYYNFSKIFHYEEGELELEIKSDRVMETEFKKGWLYDL